MRKFLNVVLSLLTLTFLFIPTTPASAAANDFYFSSAEFDYYLDRDAEGVSTLHVDEVLTAIFPSFDQNHGIERYVPLYYRGVLSIDKNSITVTRNGVSEPFSSVTEDGNFFLRIGSSSSYVHGTQVYKISYDAKNVILNPANSENQELYRDTNGTGWAQKFNSLTATVHLSDSLKPLVSSDVSCYVGRYGEKGSNLCEIEASADSSKISFKAENLRAYENLTFDLVFPAGTFSVAEASTNPLIYVFYGLLLVLFFVSIPFWIKLFSSVSEKRRLSKDSAKPVQYIPPKGLTVAESAEIYLNQTPETQVATLMELAVTHKIELIRGEKKRFKGYDWTVHVKSLDEVSETQKIVLEILNGGSSVSVGDKIEVKSRSETSHLIQLGKDYKTKTESSLRGKNLLESKKHKNSASTPVGVLLAVYSVANVASLIISSNFLSIKDVKTPLESAFTVFAVASLVAYIIIASIILSNASKFNRRTLNGIKVSNYLDGLKEYMSLAETERIKFLHSVETADLSNENIVRLYEKLLPYAIIFRLEDSWLTELNRYYEMDDVKNPTWYYGPGLFSMRDFHTFSNYASSVISSSTSSSSDSGSGGGGFSGGGGGGGGGGGW